MNWKVEEKDGGFVVTNHIGDEICFERDRQVAERIATRHNDHTCVIGFASVAVITKNGGIKVVQQYGCFNSFDNKIKVVEQLKTNAEKMGEIVIPDSTIFTEIYGSIFSAMQQKAN